MKQGVMCTAEKFCMFFSAPCHWASLTPPTEPGIASLFLQVWHLLSLLSPFFQLPVNRLFHFPALCSSPLWVFTSSTDSSSLGPLQQVILSHNLLPPFFVGFFFCPIFLPCLKSAQIKTTSSRLLTWHVSDRLCTLNLQDILVSKCKNASWHELWTKKTHMGVEKASFFFPVRPKERIILGGKQLFRLNDRKFGIVLSTECILDWSQILAGSSE